MERWLNAVWYAGAAGGGWLRPLAWIYRAVLALRRAAYRHGLLRTTRIGLPVVVIGNLTAGGTGKTPLTIWLVAQLRAAGLRPGILSRGHGRRDAAGPPLLVRPGTPPEAAGDEPVLIAASCDAPVVVCADRVAGARELERLGVDVVICDDGLQHLALARDVEIVVVDARRGFGNGRLLPAGPLREPAARLGTVDFIVMAGEGAGPAPAGGAPRLTMRLVPGEARALVPPAAPAAPAASAAAPAAGTGMAASGREAAHTLRALESFRGRPVHAVAGIGDPARFFATLRAAGLEPVEHAFPDHHAFRAPDLDFGDRNEVLMTSKDAVKCRAFADARMWEVPVRAQIEPGGGASLVTRVQQLQRAPRGAAGA